MHHRSGWRVRSDFTRRSLAIACALALLAGCATPQGTSSAGSPAGERNHIAADAGLGLGAVLSTIVYAPVKLAYAVGGSLVGGLAWAFSGGNVEGSRSVVEPAVYGDYVITPDHLQNPRSIEFVGRGPGAVDDSWRSSNEMPAVAAAPPGLRADGTVDCGSVSVLPTVHFEFGKSQVPDASAAVLDGVATVLRSCPSVSVDIQAHTDATGSDPVNARLSLERASSVRDYLVDRGVPGDRLATQGFGASRPAATNDTDRGRSQNRRAELPIR